VRSGSVELSAKRDKKKPSRTPQDFRTQRLGNEKGREEGGELPPSHLSKSSKGPLLPFHLRKRGADYKDRGHRQNQGTTNRNRGERHKQLKQRRNLFRSHPPKKGNGEEEKVYGMRERNSH